MNEELHHAWQRFRDDDGAFVLVITGAGDTTFCAGWDLQDAAELQALGDYDRYRRDLYNLPGYCGYTRKVDIFKPIIAAVNGFAFAAGSKRRCSPTSASPPRTRNSARPNAAGTSSAATALTARLPLVVGFARAMEMIITGRRVGAVQAEQYGLVNEIVPRGQALSRAQALAHEIAELPQGAIRADKETVLRGVGRTLEERLRIEAEMVISMFMRTDKHTLGAAVSRRVSGRSTGRITVCDGAVPLPLAAAVGASDEAAIRCSAPSAS